MAAGAYYFIQLNQQFPVPSSRALSVGIHERSETGVRRGLCIVIEQMHVSLIGFAVEAGWSEKRCFQIFKVNPCDIDEKQLNPPTEYEDYMK